MAKAQNNSALGPIRGRIDSWVYRTMYGQQIVGRRPDKRTRVPTGAEAATITRFALAARSARSAPPEMIARYDERARQEKKSKYSIRTRDYMVPPKIPAVYLGGYTGQPGEAIFIIARDDFEVKEVTVRIRRPDGSVLESGVADRCPDDVFRYTTTATASPDAPSAVEVTASDWAGNVTNWKSI